MERKPIILIMTSKDELKGESEELKRAIAQIGTHNVVLLTEEQYGSAPRVSRLERLMDEGADYRYILVKKDRALLRSKLRPKSASRRATRIVNAIKRYRPELILTLTPYAHQAAEEAKRKTGFSTPLIYLMPSFTVDKLGRDDKTSVYIVENADMKAELARIGVRSKNVMIMGLPFRFQPLTPLEIATSKQEYGLPRTKTVFVNVQNAVDRAEILSLLADQGDIINVVVFGEETREFAALRESAASIKGMTIVFVTGGESFDSYLGVSDVAITEFDAAVLYKCFRAGIPVIATGRGEQTEKDVEFLRSKGLLLYAAQNIDVVAELYKLLQTDAYASLSKAEKEWVEMSSAENIANYLVSYMAV